MLFYLIKGVLHCTVQHLKDQYTIPTTFILLVGVAPAFVENYHERPIDRRAHKEVTHTKKYIFTYS